jgi:hypothetical protein
LEDIEGKGGRNTIVGRRLSEFKNRHSRYTGALCITVSVPIRDASEEIMGIMGVDIGFEELVKLEEEE